MPDFEIVVVLITIVAFLGFIRERAKGVDGSAVWGRWRWWRGMQFPRVSRGISTSGRWTGQSCFLLLLLLLSCWVSSAWHLSFELFERPEQFRWSCDFLCCVIQTANRVTSSRWRSFCFVKISLSCSSNQVSFCDSICSGSRVWNAWNYSVCCISNGSHCTFSVIFWMKVIERKVLLSVEKFPPLQLPIVTRWTLCTLSIETSLLRLSNAEVLAFLWRCLCDDSEEAW